MPIDRILRCIPVRLLLRSVSKCLTLQSKKTGDIEGSVRDAEMDRRRMEKERREFRLLLLQKVFNLMLDGNDGIITKQLFFKRLKDHNDLRYAGILSQDEFLTPHIECGEI